MKHVIIGTAGHVDHGKSTLIRALTGIDPDRLKEEKQRGLTIDIGFAYFDLPSGRRAGIVDVPGHERFIKNMLAGAIGFDVVLLVVAADEGIMPQTKEHLDILSLLKIKKGLIVLTKTDLVDAEWLALIQEEIREQLVGTFLESAKMVSVSALTGIGMDKLIAHIDQLTEEAVERDLQCPFRLPIDRAFTVKGFGTVVTGTLSEGTIRMGDQAEIQPANCLTRIRNIQVHGEDQTVAEAGQRVALNLTDVSKADCQRGNILSPVGLLRPTMMLDAVLKLLPDTPQVLKHWDRIRLYTGTSEVLGRVALYGRDELWPGEEALVQFRLEQPLVALLGDLYVIRNYSPLRTIGGGKIIDANPKKKRRHKSDVLNDLELRAKGSPEDILYHSIHQAKDPVILKDEAVTHSGLREAEKALEALIRSELVFSFIVDQREYVVSSARLESLIDEIEKFLNNYHHKWPLRLGAKKAEVRSKYLTRASAKLFNQVLILMTSQSNIGISKEYIKLNEHQIHFSGKNLKSKDIILKIMQERCYTPPSLEEFADLTHLSMAMVKEILDALVYQNTIVKISEGFYLTTENFIACKENLIKYLQENEGIELGTFRNLLNTSRKYALPLLEYFDTIKITKRVGDVRMLSAVV